MENKTKDNDYYKNYCKKWKEDNPEYNKKYYEKNKEKILKQMKEKKYCTICNVHVVHKNRHNETNKHKKNVEKLKDGEFDTFELQNKIDEIKNMLSDLEKYRSKH